ncbi:MAG TPA: BamA/TamA family outer membrane protein [Polyangiaceae bacterium]|nr:BamA/TamA family outer membrane protein [Polyangiaceae bacterium]
MLRRPGAAALAYLAAAPAFARAQSDAAETDARASDTAGSHAAGQGAARDAPQTPPDDDGWPDVSGFLNEKYGFLPMVFPITEPAVGYGAVGGVAFISKPLGAARAGLGRPNITFVGGLGTENGSWGVFAADMRYWLDDRLQTLAGVAYASVNLDFHGLGKDSLLEDDPLRYQLGPAAAAVQARYRLGETLLWAGLRYAFAVTEVSFEAPPATARLPDYDESSKVGGLTAVISYDSRDNMFTPTRGSYLEANFGLYGEALGGDDQFQRAALVAIQYFPLPFGLYLGLRGDAAASFGDAPFYLQPFVLLRGVPVMRYQGEQLAQAEAELRWQFWRRFSLLGFAGGGMVWNDFARIDNSRGVVSGGAGFRYEIAREYGIHTGIDIAFSQDTTAFYLQVGSAWMRP